MKNIEKALLDAVKAQAIETYEYRFENGIENTGVDYREAALEIGCESVEVADRIEELITKVRKGR